MKCFKAYDIRGAAPDEINENLACALGNGMVKCLGIKKIAIGHDPRISGPGLMRAFCAGVNAAGGYSCAYGLCCTEEIYRLASREDFDACVMITASHNPANENGFKLVSRGAVPISRNSGLEKLERFVENSSFAISPSSPVFRADMKEPRLRYVDWLLSYTGLGSLPPANLKILACCGNGAAGELVKELVPHLPFEVIMTDATPDGHFPNGVPNPLLPENRERAATAVHQNNVDFGVAWDGDADRCFFYDAQGSFIDGYYIVGLLAKSLLSVHPGEKILHDPRVYWNTRKCVLEAGGIPVMAKTGHAFMKEKMRAENALYGGEMSAHHYFRDFAFCDSGMLPWLLMSLLVANSSLTLEEMVDASQKEFPSSGEINMRVENAPLTIRKIEKKYADTATHIDHLDGLNMEFPQWRFSLRLSNTEPLLRLNVEARGDAAIVTGRASEIQEQARIFGGNL